MRETASACNGIGLGLRSRLRRVLFSGFVCCSKVCAAAVLFVSLAQPSLPPRVVASRAADSGRRGSQGAQNPVLQDLVSQDLVSPADGRDSHDTCLPGEMKAIHSVARINCRIIFWSATGIRVFRRRVEFSSASATSVLEISPVENLEIIS